MGNRLILTERNLRKLVAKESAADSPPTDDPDL